jgi:hypothetical protein
MFDMHMSMIVYIAEAARSPVVLRAIDRATADGLGERIVVACAARPRKRPANTKTPRRNGVFSH